MKLTKKNLTKKNLTKMSKADLLSNLEASGINTDSLRDLTEADLVTAILEMKDQFDATKQAEQEAAAILTDADATVEPEVTEEPVTEQGDQQEATETPAPEAPKTRTSKFPKLTQEDLAKLLAGFTSTKPSHGGVAANMDRARVLELWYNSNTGKFRLAIAWKYLASLKDHGIAYTEMKGYGAIHDIDGADLKDRVLPGILEAITAKPEPVAENQTEAETTEA